jgi:hypothetical protein
VHCILQLRSPKSRQEHLQPAGDRNRDTVNSFSEIEGSGDRIDADSKRERQRPTDLGEQSTRKVAAPKWTGKLGGRRCQTVLEGESTSETGKRPALH